MGATILSFSDRVVIETLHNEKRSLQYIADYLGFSKTTIFNELHRLDVTYQAQLAQADFEKKVTQRGRKSSLTTNLKRLIEEKIKVQKWSAEQVAHVVGIAYKSIYNWIDQGLLDLRLKDLPDHGICRYRAKENVVPLVMDARLKNVQQISRLAKNSAILKLIQCSLVNAKDKPSLLLWNGRVA